MAFGRLSIHVPRHFLLHLSDTHLVEGPGPLYGAVDSEARLRQIFAELDASRARPDALVFTGDLADKGEPDAYRSLRSIVEPVADRSVPVIWAMGNHDDRAAFRRTFWTKHRLRTARPGLRRRRSARDHPRLHGPGDITGEIGDDQLSWLAAELATPAEHGTILALHHPPVPCVLDLAVLVELRDQRRSRTWCAAATFGPSWPVTCTTRRPRRSPASRCRSRPRPATPRTSTSRPEHCAAATTPRASTSCTSTRTPSCTRWSRSTRTDCRRVRLGRRDGSKSGRGRRAHPGDDATDQALTAPTAPGSESRARGTP